MRDIKNNKNEKSEKTNMFVRIKKDQIFGLLFLWFDLNQIQN